MSINDRRRSERPHKTPVCYNDSASDESLNQACAWRANSVGPGRARSPSRGRKESRMCTKSEFNKLMSDIALLATSMIEVKTHIGLIKSDNVTDGGQAVTDVTVGDLAVAEGTPTASAAAAAAPTTTPSDDSVIARNTDRLNKLEDALMDINNKLTGIDAFMKDVRDDFTKMRNPPATYSQVANGMPLPPPSPSSPVTVPPSSPSSSPSVSSSPSSSSPPSAGTSPAPNGHHPHPPSPAHHPPAYPATNLHNPAAHPPMNPHQ